ncbi:MAG TPA: efflux RND transporter permease subunit [Pseudomonadota bacterium]|nr:efflux RND transporter permease subunit [Pseudomonadota bacterium]
MLKKLVEASLRFRVLVLAAAVVLLLLGVRAAQQTPIDVFPEFARPMVEIQTEAPGLSTEEVESLITQPIEMVLAGLPELETLRSKSVLGLSSVVLLLREDADVMPARQMVQERLAVAASRLPAVARPPVMMPPLSSTSRALKIGVWSRKLSQMELSELVRWTIRPRLMAVPGVANVTIWGLRDRQLQVWVDSDKLRAHDLTLDAVMRATADAAAVSAGGFLDTANQRMAVRHLSSLQTPADLAAAVVTSRGGAALRIGDVAQVVVGHAPPIGDAVINGGPGLLLIVEKQPTGNTLSLTREVEAALALLRPGLADVEIDSTIFRPAGFIEKSLQNLRSALCIGCVLVVLILLFFLRDLRTAAISLTAIPLSLVGALVVLWLRGGTLNTLFLAGLVIAVGEVVDDAIIDVENIRRRLRQSPEQPPLRVVLAASLEVRSAVVYASLIVSLVFLPVFFMGGLGGAFFRPLALAYVLSILASLGVALTVTPAMALWLLPRGIVRDGDGNESQREPAHLMALRRMYRRLLTGLLVRPRLAVLILVGSTLLAVGTLPLLGDEFLPDFKETDFLMHWVEKPGASIEASRRSTLRISQELLAIPGVRNFGSHIGRAEIADEVVGPHFTEHWISIAPQADYTRTLARIHEVVAGYPGLFRDVLTYLKERIKDVLSGTSAAIVVRIYGPDLSTLRQQAQQVAGELKQISGVVDLKVEPQVDVPQVEVRLRPAQAALHGVTAGQLRRAVSTLVSGQKVGEIYERQGVQDVVVWSPPTARADLSALRHLLIDTPHGTPVPLGDVADVAIHPAASDIKREGGSRRIDVSCNVRGRDLGSVAEAVEQKVRSLSFPTGYHPEFLGEFAAHKAARKQMLLLSVVALLGIFGLLYLDFRSLRLVLLLIGTLPSSLIGGVVGALLSGGVLSLGSIVGFVSVFGIASRNGIMILSHYRHLENEEGVPPGPHLVLRGAEERLIPVLMTALCAGLSLLPIVVRGALPGYEIEHPMAVVIIGGLLSSTSLNLLLMPVLYSAYGRPR